MKVLCVIVTYNGDRWIRKCIESLLASNPVPEILVVDNASTDATLETLRAFGDRISITALKKNIGFGKANNIGMSLAYTKRADYAFLVNQDVYLKPDTLSLLVSAAEKEPEYGILSPMHLNGQFTALDRKFLDYIEEEFCPGLISDIYLKNVKQTLYQVEFVNAAAWLVTRKCLETVGGFNPSFLHYAEDDNYVSRLKFHGLKVGILCGADIAHDREQRPRSNYFIDDKLVYPRIITEHLSRPSGNPRVSKEYSRLIRKIFKAAISFDKTLFFKSVNRIGILRNFPVKQVMENRKSTLVPQASFLSPEQQSA